MRAVAAEDKAHRATEVTPAHLSMVIASRLHGQRMVANGDQRAPGGAMQGVNGAVPGSLDAHPDFG
jgi:hypothetical protein